MIDYKNRKSLWLMPDWVRDMQAVEEGPLSLEELQRLDLYAQKQRLESVVAQSELRKEELSREKTQADTKIEHMKKNYIHKKKIANLRLARKAKKSRDNNEGEVEEEDHDEEDEEGDHEAVLGRPSAQRPIPTRPDGNNMLAGNSQYQAHRGGGVSDHVNAMESAQTMRLFQQFPTSNQYNYMQHQQEQQQQQQPGVSAGTTTVPYYPPNAPETQQQRTQQEAAQNGDGRGGPSTLGGRNSAWSTFFNGFR
mmetsp:Transcript_24817/g.71183  ORF Transcript_24817/g.71183 Transcript_24817/m.71183 type:complete len:251 (-) Transcript_24817:22-774(-)